MEDAVTESKHMGSRFYPPFHRGWGGFARWCPDVELHRPQAGGVLSEAIACGEPIWGTLEQAAREKGFSDREIADFVRELNAL